LVLHKRKGREGEVQKPGGVCLGAEKKMGRKERSVSLKN